MKRKRLDRDLKWGFQYFPYYQMRVDCDMYHGLVSLIQLVDGEYYYWDMPKAGKIAVCGKGMTWLQLIPDDRKRLITVMYLPDSYSVSGWYVDVMEGFEFDSDGVAVYIDKYLDVIFTPQGDVRIDDRDELDEAYQSGELTQEQYESALEECDLIVKELCSDIGATQKWCTDILKLVNKRIAEGEKPLKKRRWE